MRTHTTFTDLRRIMKLHSQEMGVEDIAREVSVAVSEVEHCIAVRTKSKRKSRKKADPFVNEKKVPVTEPAQT